jgi:catechol 2,3-dioxygenase-like lactoylglutathione lyase family enzyme
MASRLHTLLFEKEAEMASPNIRYIVEDVDDAVSFYTRFLGFQVEFRPAPSFAILTRDDLRLALNATEGPGGASQPMDDGRKPAPGGWNRILLEVPDIESLADELRASGVTLRSRVIQGIGGKQVLVDDPSGNPIELFEPKR